MMTKILIQNMFRQFLKKVKINYINISMYLPRGREGSETSFDRAACSRVALTCPHPSSLRGRKRCGRRRQSTKNKERERERDVRSVRA